MKLSHFITAAALLAPWSAQASYFPSDYDGAFKDAALFLPYPHDWQLLKAQCWQESRLEPLAVSPAGAFGLCQFMPGTAKEMRDRYGLSNLWVPEQSILAAARYMGQQGRMWSSRRTWQSRYKLALASYNSGAGYWIQAQKLCSMAVEYDHIAPCLHSVPRVKADEPLDYVKLIWGRWWPLVRAD